ncbi:hypothetical protein F511_23149 [Dorcoceras hygrometricum]|uniref:Uncharacterized protein n=1 Tax=Dorcoceras hygrometricum TaxID=472368 RepID=A0A2Z7C291_9LAMI|nr:hypothetical protein F511_23149 [Dorcoceras hygrometricum]
MQRAIKKHTLEFVYSGIFNPLRCTRRDGHGSVWIHYLYWAISDDEPHILILSRQVNNYQINNDPPNTYNLRASPGSIHNIITGLKEMGIDQLGFQSVQLGYLKILQMGNTDPNNTNAGKEYENIGHQGLLIAGSNLNRAYIPAQCINQGNHWSVIFRPVIHHSSVVFRHNQSVGHHSDDSVVPFRHDTSVGQSQRGSISGSQSIKAQYYATSTDLTRHDYSTCPTASPLVTAHSRSCPEAKFVKEISYLSSQLHFSSLILTLRTHSCFYLAKQLLTARIKLNHLPKSSRELKNSRV